LDRKEKGEEPGVIGKERDREKSFAGDEIPKKAGFDLAPQGSGKKKPETSQPGGKGQHSGSLEKTQPCSNSHCGGTHRKMKVREKGRFQGSGAGAVALEVQREGTGEDAVEPEVAFRQEQQRKGHRASLRPIGALPRNLEPWGKEVNLQGKESGFIAAKQKIMVPIERKESKGASWGIMMEKGGGDRKKVRRRGTQKD